MLAYYALQSSEIKIEIRNQEMELHEAEIVIKVNIDAEINL